MTSSSVIRKINELQRRGALNDSEREIESSRQDLSESEYLLCIGNQFFYKRNYSEAIKHYQMVFSLEPNIEIPQYFYLAGVSNERNEDYVQAFKYYQAAIESDRSFVEPYVELGGLLVKVGDFKGAAQCYEDAIACDPNDLGNYANLLVAYQQLVKEDPAIYTAKFKNAEKQYAEAKSRLPPVPEGHKW